MRIFDKIDHGKVGVLPSSNLVDLIETIGGGGVVVRICRVICRKYTKIKVVFWTVFPF